MMTALQHQETLDKTTKVSRESHATQSYPSHTIVHAKLEMTEPGDHDELEAEEMANTIVSGGKISRKISGGASGSSGIAVSQQMERQLAHLQSGGRQMPEGLRNMMENGFGRDFSQVRLHTDSEAAEMSSSIHAKAFTHGNDIYFNRGQFAPETSEGQHLVAHELTHVVQGTGKVGREPNSVEPAATSNDKKAQTEFRIILFLLLHGFNKTQICAILGNWQHESNLDPFAVEGVIYKGQERIDNYMVWTKDREKGSQKTLEEIYKNNPKILNKLSQPKAKAGGGIGQWTGNRAARLATFAKNRGGDIHDLQIQLDFALHENRNDSFNPDTWNNAQSFIVESGEKDPLKKSVEFFLYKFEGLRYSQSETYQRSLKDRIYQANYFLKKYGLLIDELEALTKKTKELIYTFYTSAKNLYELIPKIIKDFYNLLIPNNSQIIQGTEKEQGTGKEGGDINNINPNVKNDNTNLIPSASLNRQERAEFLYHDSPNYMNNAVKGLRLFSTKEESKALTKTVEVPIWTEDKIGNRVPGVLNLRVHHKLIAMVKQIFTEVYANSAEDDFIILISKIPPHPKKGEELLEKNQSAGWNYRYESKNYASGDSRLESYSEHAGGVAIDLNTSFNPFATENKYDAPNNNKYMAYQNYIIKSDSILVKTFKKYGWKWGGEWKEKKDFMHFEWFSKTYPAK